MGFGLVLRRPIETTRFIRTPNQYYSSLRIAAKTVKFGALGSRPCRASLAANFLLGFAENAYASRLTLGCTARPTSGASGRSDLAPPGDL
jgi:hypothetical protein